ncbi:MAG: type II secretion system F family protein [Candidatus Omnitrophica bacterium]|nr:type II secretion system F family protein [Candidatus Omnitrophota bacterium]
MPTYTYKARDAAGKSVKGTMETENKTELIDRLHKMGYMTTSASEVASGRQFGLLFDKLKWIAASDMLMFYIQLSNMINAGITILTSLSILANQIENRGLKEAVGSVARQVEGGSLLSRAFRLHPRIFSKLFVSMIEVGEESGKLDTVLSRYADFFEQQEELKQKIKGALFYPLILFLAGAAVSLFIVTFIIPQFAQIYLKAGIKLPLPTLIVFKVGLAIKRYWYLLVIFVIAIILGLRYYFKTEKGGFLFDTLKLRAPIIGSLYRKAVISRFSRTLSTLLGSGVPILKSLDITKEVLGNLVLARVITNVRKSVENGEHIAEPLKISGEFPPDVAQMISVGEETGGLVEMLYKIANFYDLAVSYAVKKLTTVIEPLFLVIMGSMVGLIMASMLMPMFDLVKTLRR